MQPKSDRPTEIDDLASYCKATADQQRLMILRVLSRESYGVLELCHILDVAQPALSHHLKVLHKAGLVDTRRQGTSIFYRRAAVNSQDPIRDLRQSLFATVDHMKLGEEIVCRSREVYATRADHAKQFFEKNGHKFQENQDLIAEYPHYASCITDLLDSESITDANDVIEIGPGDSDLIVDLSRRFGHTVAIDNTAEMLEKTRQKLARLQITDVDYFHGELENYQASADLIVINMVLHHLASPAQFLNTSYRQLNDGGSLLIADLCAHDHDWTRDACGDLWLGFEPDELDRWAIASGFTQGQSAYLGLNNGFQVQVRVFHKH